MRGFSHKKTRPRPFALWILFSLCTGAEAETVAETRSITREWVALEQAISREAADAERTRILTTDRIAVLEAELARLRAERAQSESQVSQADAERKALVEKQADMALHHAHLKSLLSAAEPQLKKMRPRLPESLSHQLTSLFQRIPADPAQPERGLAERLQTVIGIISNIQTFNDSITVVSEVKALNEAPKAEITTLYVGLGQAYYLSSQDAGYGYPEGQGWIWVSQPELKQAIAEAIASAEGRSAEPSFIPLPVKLAPETEQ